METAPPVVATVLYDADCPMCRNLAELAARRAGAELAFESWQTWQSRTTTGGGERGADKLRVFTDTGALLEGEEAWAFLVAAHPDLGALDWLAAKLELRPNVARGLMRAGDLLRRFCTRCGRRKLSPSSSA